MGFARPAGTSCVLQLAGLSSHLLFDGADYALQQFQQAIGERLKSAVLPIGVVLLAMTMELAAIQVLLNKALVGDESLVARHADPRVAPAVPCRPGTPWPALSCSQTYRTPLFRFVTDSCTHPDAGAAGTSDD